MRKICKLIKLMTLGLTSYIIVRFLKKTNEYLHLKESISSYIIHITGIKPTVKTQLAEKSLTIEIGLPKKIIEQDNNIEDKVTLYISDYHPTLQEYRLKIIVFSID